MPQRIESDRAFLTTEGAREKTGFSIRYVQQLLQDKRIEGFKVGPVWFVYEDSLIAFAAQPRKRGPKGPHKKSKQDQVDTSSNAEHIERTPQSDKGQDVQESQDA